MIIVLIISIILVVLFTIGIIKISGLKEKEEKLDISLEKIEELVNNKDENVNKILDIISDDKLRARYVKSDNVIDNENNIFSLYWDIKKYLKEKNINNDEINNIVKEIDKYEDDLEGLKDFYNSSVNIYNNYFYKKPFNIMYKVFRYNEKQKFISKKIESYEILKD